MSLVAFNFLRDMGAGGDTRPQLFECDHDGVIERWVLKLAGSVAPPAELAADWLGALLAHRIGIPTPEVAIAEVDAESLATAPESVRAWGRPGAAFASKLVENAQPVIDDRTVLELDGDALGRLYALDTWLETLDRKKPNGVWNLLTTNRTGSVCAIDFGKALTPCLFPLVRPDARPREPGYPSAVRWVASLTAAREACSIIERVETEEIRELVESVPPSWLTTEQRTCIVQFLGQRQSEVRSVCEAALTER